MDLNLGTKVGFTSKKNEKRVPYIQIRELAPAVIYLFSGLNFDLAVL